MKTNIFIVYDRRQLHYHSKVNKSNDKYSRLNIER
jgi:hypothetical protein